ncbi:MAG: hypothetical protein EXR80_04840 [Methylococcales bacterium]|nr:hypothetical protein [Methylococcales bacterium]
MPSEENIKETLFEYVKNPKKWFYWYHNPARLEELYNDDYKDNPDYKKDTVVGFTKKVWRFESQEITNQVFIEQNLFDFFSVAVLDETRIKKANAFSEYVLYITDNEDLAYFRDTVAKREIIADIDYNRQRDHAVHTLYNYLWGWYLFEHSETLRNNFKNRFNDLNTEIKMDHQKESLLSYYENKEIPESKEFIAIIHEFVDVWVIASLLHDIGYILEGDISSASPAVEKIRIINGSKIIHDYFNHYFWKSFEVDFRVAKNIAKALGVVVPDFKYSESLASLGDRLCDIGSCENIRDAIFTRYTSKYTGVKPIAQLHGLNREAFFIWKEHYKFYDNKKMEYILLIVERVYKNTMWVGSDHGQRNLDHGVGSGLITLQALTFFRALYWGFKQNDWSEFNNKQTNLGADSCNLVSEELFGHVKDEITHMPKRIQIRRKFDPNFWFNQVLWATASSAIHSIVQKLEYRKQCEKHMKESGKNPLYLRISLEDDPLNFLGILVDILQEWDRYKVTNRGEAAFSGNDPLQSTQVKLDYDDNSKKISLKYPKNWLEKKKLQDDIDKCLYFDDDEKKNEKKWSDFLEITKID